MNVKSSLYHIILNVIIRFLGWIGISRLQNLIFEIIARVAIELPPKEGLRFLFNLDSLLYPLQGQLASVYEGGTHPKHRLMRYHDFFVNRIKPKERVLDIGCGIGAVAYDVAVKAEAEVVGIDLNETNIDIARKRYTHPRVQYILGDALKNLPDGKFDVVILSNVLEHLTHRSEFLKRVQKTVNPDRVLIRVPLFERDWRVPLKYELGVEWRLDGTHETEYSIESFAEEVKDARGWINYQEIRWGEIWAEIAIGNES